MKMELEDTLEQSSKFRFKILMESIFMLLVMLLKKINSRINLIQACQAGKSSERKKKLL